MNIIINGATGFVGSWLVDECLEQKENVTIIVRNKSKIPDKWKGKLRVIEASLEQLSKLNVSDFEGEQDLFFHLAWAGTSGNERADVDLQLNNVRYTCDALNLASSLGCKRFVNAGSIMEYEVMEYVSKDGATPGLGNIYSTAKLTADFMAKTIANSKAIGYINVIISNIYGVGEVSARFLNTTLRKMIHNEEIPLTHGEQLYDFIYASDAAKAILLAGKKGIYNENYYIGNPTQKPLKEYIKEMKKIVGSSSDLLFGKVPFTGAILNYTEFDTNKMTELGFEIRVSFKEGIEMVRDWMKE